MAVLKSALPRVGTTIEKDDLLRRGEVLEVQSSAGKTHAPQRERNFHVVLDLGEIETGNVFFSDFNSAT